MKFLATILGAIVLSTGISNGAGAKTGGKAKPAEKEKAAPGAPTPAPEIKRLGDLVGTWKIDGQVQKSPMGPGGKTTGTDTCGWFDGNFFVVCHSSATTPMGSSTGMNIFGWDADHKTYTFQSIDSTGMASTARGKIDGQTWTWSSEEKMGGKTMKSRFVVTQTSPDRNHMSWSISPDGQTWSELFSGDESREKSTPKKKAK